MECNAGDVLLLHNLTPHASFTNSTADTVRWSLDLRYSDHAAPNNVGESPESYTPERDPVTMYVCHCYHSKGIATAATKIVPNLFALKECAPTVARLSSRRACYPPEADFVVTDSRHPEREVRTSEEFQHIRRMWKGAHSPGRGWPPMPPAAAKL